MENKKRLIIIGTIILVVIIAMVGVLLLVLGKDDKEEPKENEEPKTNYKKLDVDRCDANLYIGFEYGEAYFPLDEKAQKELNKILKDMEYEETDEVEDLQTIKPMYYDTNIKVCDITLSYNEGYTYSVINYRNKANIKSKKKELDAFIEGEKAKLGSTYQIFNYVANINEKWQVQDLMDDDKIVEAWKKNSREIQPIDLAILVSYIIFIDGDVLETDGSFRYAYLNGTHDIIALSDELQANLGGQQIKKPIEGGCCSCCPDLKPGESCIDACCPCN